MPELLYLLSVAACVFLILALLRRIGPLRQRGNRRRRASRSAGVPWRSTWGTVYVHQFVDRPHRFKVGYTAGLARTRQTGIRSKVKATTGMAPELRQVFAVDMHYARRVEKLVLAALDRHKAPIGTMEEFFRFPETRDPGEIIDHISCTVHACALQVRRDAIRDGRWTGPMDAKARLVRLTRAGRLIRRPLFQDPGPNPQPQPEGLHHDAAH